MLGIQVIDVFDYHWVIIMLRNAINGYSTFLVFNETFTPHFQCHCRRKCERRAILLVIRFKSRLRLDPN